MSLVKTIGAVSIAAVTLGACGDINAPENQKTRNGAVIGAAVGIASQIIGGNSKSAILKGAVIGGTLGAIGGSLLDKQEAELRRDLAGSGAQITNNGSELVVTLPEAITFATGSAYVRPSLQDNLRNLAANLQKYPNSTIDVVGHTDSVGGTDYNQDLSTRRAASVSAILAQNGVSGGRINTFGRGETNPVASNGTTAGRAQNRRVEVVIRPS